MNTEDTKAKETAQADQTQPEDKTASSSPLGPLMWIAIPLILVVLWQAFAGS